MTDELATIRASAQKLRAVIEQGAANYHSDILLSIQQDYVETLMQTNQRTVVSYNTWSADYFDEVDGEGKAILPVGLDADSRGILDYMAFVERGTDTVEFALEVEDGDDPAREDLATYWRARGGLNARLKLPHSESDIEAVPWDHVPRWTPNEEYASRSCLTEDGTLPDDEEEWVTPPTTVETTADVIQENIIQPADLADGVKYRPITVEDEEFTVDVQGSQHSDRIWGDVNAEDVDGPDADRKFPEEEFDAVFGTLSGPVRIQTAPEDDEDGGGVPAPLTAVQDDRDDRTIRHLVSALEG